jgi:hypothetical protein
MVGWVIVMRTLKKCFCNHFTKIILIWIVSEQQPCKNTLNRMNIIHLKTSNKILQNPWDIAEHHSLLEAHTSSICTDEHEHAWQVS